MLSQAELIYSIACTVYVATCLMFAAVRWFHVCPPAKEHTDYYYPARRVVSMSYLTPIVLLPYMLYPQSHEAWLLVKGFMPLVNFYVCAVLMFTYFGKMKRWGRWRGTGLVATLLVFGVVALLAAVALWPGCHVTAVMERVLMGAIIGVGLLMTLYSFLAVWQVWQWIRELNTDNYSNPDDFPKSYAQHVLLVPVAQAVLIWPILVLDSQSYAAVVHLLLAVFNVAFLISILSPKREEAPFSQMLDEQPDVAPLPIAVSSSENRPKPKVKPREMPEQTRQKIVDGIENALTRQQLFLNPHLTLGDVAEVCGYGQTYVSKVFKETYGGFYDHINMLRFRSANDYLHQHPGVTKEEAIIKAGFSDRTAYYRIKKHLSLDGK